MSAESEQTEAIHAQSESYQEYLLCQVFCLKEYFHFEAQFTNHYHLLYQEYFNQSIHKSLLSVSLVFYELLLNQTFTRTQRFEIHQECCWPFYPSKLKHCGVDQASLETRCYLQLFRWKQDSKWRNQQRLVRCAAT